VTHPKPQYQACDRLPRLDEAFDFINKGSGASPRSSICFDKHNDRQQRKLASQVGPLGSRTLSSRAVLGDYPAGLSTARLDIDRLVVVRSCGKKQGSDMAGHRGSQWTAEEDRRLLDLIRMNKSWVLISAALSRNVKSIRDRARHLQRQSKTETAGPGADRGAGIGV
jgi:hypothetical protein